MTDYFKRIDSMLAQHKMPLEYQYTKSLIYCNDCEKKSMAPFHFLYHKCGHCGGYNSKVLQTLEQSDSIGDDANSTTENDVKPGTFISTSRSSSTLVPDNDPLSHDPSSPTITPSASNHQ